MLELEEEVLSTCHDLDPVVRFESECSNEISSGIPLDLEYSNGDMLGDQFMCGDSDFVNFGIGPVIVKDDINGDNHSNGVFITHIGYEFAKELNKPPVLVRQIPSRGLSYQLWPSAIALCSFLESFSIEISSQGNYEAKRLQFHTTDSNYSESWLKGKSVLEIGAGTGLVGITASRFGANSVITDLPGVVENLDSNYEINSTAVLQDGGLVQTKQLRWGDHDDMVEVHGKFDIILGADIVYDVGLFAPLIQTLRWLMMKKKEWKNILNERNKSLNNNDCYHCDGSSNGELEDECRKPFIILAHLRRWKKDNKFFKLASKYFLVNCVHRFQPSEARKGVEIYVLSARS